MYERGKGLGWSQIEGYPTCDQVAGGGTKRCFLPTTEDEQCAQYSGCINLNESCRTTSGGIGRTWCCPPNLPPPPWERCIPEGVDPTQPRRQMICRQQEVSFDTLHDTRRRAIWRVQNKLCQLGVDPGPVDGQGTNSMYRIAIRQYQSINNLPQTGEVSTAMLSSMGFSASDASEIESGLNSGPLPTGSGLSDGMTRWFWPIAFSLSSVFLGVAWWKYGRR